MNRARSSVKRNRSRISEENFKVECCEGQGRVTGESDIRVSTARIFILRVFIRSGACP